MDNQVYGQEKGNLNKIIASINQVHSAEFICFVER